MNKRWMLLLLCLLCALPLGGLADEAAEPAVSLLTEVYGYTDEEARAFTFESTTEGELQQFAFYPAEHPDWRYTASFWSSGEFADAQTPFRPLSGQQTNAYPGEATVRDGLRQAREQGWLTDWNAQSQAAFSAWAEQWGFRLNAELSSLSAAEALQAYFTSAYGDPLGWSQPIREWLEAELAAFGLTVAPQTVAFTGVRTRADQGLGDENVTLTEFCGEAPAELQALHHPKLEGWSLRCGAYRAYQGATPLQSGVLAYQQGDRLLLAVCARKGADDAWSVYPISEQAAPETFVILGSAERWQYDLCTVLSDTATERFSVLVQSAAEGCEGYLLQLKSYQRTDGATGVTINDEGSRVQEDADWLHVLTYAADGSAQEALYPATFSCYLNFWDLAEFPRSADECARYAGITLPADTGITTGVHLRESTSSRSRDLGLYNVGTLVRILGTEPGDPNPWVHVRVGSREGYMSSLYVSYPGSPCSMKPLSQCPPLPVGVTKREVGLKTGMGWLDGTAMTLPAGAKLHVLATLDGWAHVMAPRGELDWRMDTEGTDGYLRLNELALYATSMQADWGAQEGLEK